MDGKGSVPMLMTSGGWYELTEEAEEAYENDGKDGMIMDESEDSDIIGVAIES